jgi:hypothetical protein
MGFPAVGTRRGELDPGIQITVPWGVHRRTPVVADFIVRRREFDLPTQAGEQKFHPLPSLRTADYGPALFFHLISNHGFRENQMLVFFEDMGFLRASIKPLKIRRRDW